MALAVCTALTGCGWSPPPAASLEETAIGGLGIHLMRGFSSQMYYERIADLNRLKMVFSFARYAPGGSAQTD